MSAKEQRTELKKEMLKNKKTLLPLVIKLAKLQEENKKLDFPIEVEAKSFKGEWELGHWSNSSITLYKDHEPRRRGIGMENGLIFKPLFIRYRKNCRDYDELFVSLKDNEDREKDIVSFITLLKDLFETLEITIDLGDNKLKNRNDLMHLFLISL